MKGIIEELKLFAIRSSKMIVFLSAFLFFYVMLYLLYINSETYDVIIDFIKILILAAIYYKVKFLSNIK